MNNLMISDIKTIPSYEIAKMMEKSHANVLTMIHGKSDRKGIIQVLTEVQMDVSEYFIENTYKDASGKENKCYECTKMGCELLANKMTGDKGVVFSARYVKRFNEMEQRNELTKKQELQLKILNGEGLEQISALKEYEKVLTQPLIDKIEEDKPKVTFADRVLKSKDNVLIRQVAKIASDEGFIIGERKLYNKLREWGYICKTSTEPTQVGMERGYFVVKVGTVDTPYGIKTTRTTLVTPKGQVHIVERLLKQLENKLLTNENK